MNEPTRRAWSSPELIVLVRGKPEEAVLGSCKYTTSGPVYWYNDCILHGTTYNCEFCNALIQS